MGFTASNPKTKTEELVGLKMHLMYNMKNKRTYQEFFLHNKYNQVYNSLRDMKAHQFEMTINNNKFTVLLKIVDTNIVGL